MRSNLVKERKSKDLTRSELADKLGIAEITVRKIEEGNRNPSPQMAKKFALFYKKELDYLFPDIFLIKFDTKRNKNSSY
ncbi:helix-turn-helix transcriptional regulator [Desemzia sp. C1]|uniref:helix-turn-helix transcriptional regulator n=1 Tax=Desemzia sp. C1 TaxID=2892016 RepID=UPI001E45273D|nr:helix-turn-helix transcriptional regulator [Desemzia sp. C1]MCI3027730.1 helix-turn-helix transcriptional regulator [Desemzia sp. C1]